MVIANFHSSLKHKFSSNILRNKYGKMYSNNNPEQQIVSKILDTRDILAHFTLPNLPSLTSLVLSYPFLIQFTRISPMYDNLSFPPKVLGNTTKQIICNLCK